MMKSTPVRCSSVRMLRPSRPMMRPFMSSDESSTIETVVSAAWLAATRWKRVRNEVPRLSAGFCLCFLFELANAARELVANELLRPRHHLRLGLSDRQPRDPLELLELLVLRLFQFLLQLLRVGLAIHHSLLATIQLRHATINVLFQRAQPLLCLNGFDATGLYLLLDFRSRPDRFFLRLELGLTTDGIGLSSSICHDQLPGAPCRAELRAGLKTQEEQRSGHSNGDPDGDADHDRGHALLRLFTTVAV